MEYKLELYDYLFKALTSQFYDFERYNNIVINKIEIDEDNNCAKQEVIYQIVTNHSCEDNYIYFKIENDQKDDIFSFDDKNIKITISKPDSTLPKVMNNYDINKIDSPNSFIFKDINKFIREKVAMSEKMLIETEIDNFEEKIKNNNKKRI